MNWWEGLLLGMVQGLTEFLPISSSGHLVVTEAVLGVSTPGVVVEVTLHVATLLAVVIVYRARLWDLVRGTLRGQREALRYVGLLALATVPAGLVGFFFESAIERSFDSLSWVGVHFVITGFFLWSTRLIRGGASALQPTAAGAGGVGLAQALAILPGISRSGTTIAAGMWLRLDPVRAAEFSFLMAIPAIAGAAVLQLPHLAASIASIGLGSLAGSFLAALIAGIGAIRVLVVLLRRGAFYHFAPYCWAVGLGTILWALLH